MGTCWALQHKPPDCCRSRRLLLLLLLRRACMHCLRAGARLLSSQSPRSCHCLPACPPACLLRRSPEGVRLAETLCSGGQCTISRSNACGQATHRCRTLMVLPLSLPHRPVYRHKLCGKEAEVLERPMSTSHHCLLRRRPNKSF